MAKNICFYSNKCKWSKAFLSELSNTPWKTSFQFICVDPSPSRPQLPKWLTKVPTIVVAGTPEPLTDSEVMNWLYEKKQREMPASQGSGVGPEPSEPVGFSSIEHRSFGKGLSYSSLDADTSAQGSGGYTMPGTFSFLNGGSSPGERTGQDFPGGSSAPDSNRKKTKKEELFDKQMEQYQRERDKGIQMGPGRV
jgi:hypothetical protein